MADCAFYVEDAVGDKFLYTVADESYEPQFRKHANWWKGYMRYPGQRLRWDGKPVPKPCFPVRTVVEPIVRA